LDNYQNDEILKALRDSGFLLVKSSLLPLELQQKAFNVSSRLLETSSKTVRHPLDPKRYIMMGFDELESEDDVTILKEYYKSLREVRDVLLRSIASGIGIDPNFFTQLHDEDNDSIRLLEYLPGDEATGNRCKEHSDYGTLTLLLTDGLGLEAFVDGQWRAVPAVEGALVVNIGSILAEWTRNDLKATLHRVAGPATTGSPTSRDDLLKAVSLPRRSIAYFSDPNSNVSTALSNSKDCDSGDDVNMTIHEYIQWRSGGTTNANRSGVAFTSNEEERLAG
jgi:isopenicillin N synthase-like dioxygenase